MNFINFRLSGIVIAELLSVILPFIMAFRKEWRFSAAKITGILTGYLFLMCLAATACLGLSGEGLCLPWLCISMGANVLVCRLISKTGWKATVYTLFLFKNFADIAILLGRLPGTSWGFPSPGGASLAVRLLILTIIVWGAYCLLHEYLIAAVESACPLPVWKRLASIPILFFLVFHLDADHLTTGMFMAEYPHAFLSVLGWLGCVYMVHLVVLGILTRLAQGYAIKEQYRTTKFLASVQTSQMAALQYNLDRLRKTRHDYRHHLITLKGLLDQNKQEQARDYINGYLGSSEAHSMVEYCSNASSNAILNYYIQLARDRGVDLETSISLPPSLPLPDIDFCTILGNLLSNAVEACLRQTSSPAFIKINIGQAGKSMIALSVRNTYTHPIRLKDGCFMSSKREDLGTGTASVRYLAERYNGILNYTYKDGIFEASLLLNPPDQ